MQHCHLREQTVLCFRYNDASRAIENFIGGHHPTPDRQAMHETTLVGSRFEP
jgi:hypothetical protein